MKDEGCDHRKVIGVALAFALCGVILILWMTGPWGLTLSTDAVFYVQAAKSFSQGDGFLTYGKDAMPSVLTLYPPLYCALLGAGRWFGMEVLVWARYLNAGLFGLNILFVSALAFALTQRISAVVFAGVLALTCVHFVELHVAALSEPLFIALMLSSFLALIAYVEKEKWSWLAAAAVLAGSSVMTRYAGLAVIVTAVIVLFGKGRWKSIMAYLAIALPLPVIWALRNFCLTGEAGWVRPQLAGVSFDGIGQMINALSLYVLPASVPSLLRISALALVILTGVLFTRAGFRKVLRPGRPQERVLVIFVGVYAVMVNAAFFLSHGEAALSTRIMLPVVVFALPFAAAWPVSFPAPSRRRLAIGAVLLVIGIMAARTGQFTARIYHNGLSYGSRAWTSTKFVGMVKTLADNIPVYSNAPEAFYFYTGRPAVQIPPWYRDAGPLASAEFVHNAFMKERALAVIFNEKDFDPNPAWWQIVRTTRLKRIFDDGWGAVYAVDRREKGVR